MFLFGTAPETPKSKIMFSPPPAENQYLLRSIVETNSDEIPEFATIPGTQTELPESSIKGNSSKKASPYKDSRDPSLLNAIKFTNDVLMGKNRRALGHIVKAQQHPARTSKNRFIDYHLPANINNPINKNIVQMARARFQDKTLDLKKYFQNHNASDVHNSNILTNDDSQ
jgi:4-hydroxy-L-threonine phosphate dehydrogenase PdxA